MMQSLKHSRVCKRTRRNYQNGRRGFSMMLVLISLGTATILTTAYVTARDNSTIIGQNVVYAAEARSAATSGLDLGVAVLQTDSDWRTAHTGGVLIDDYAIGGGTLDVIVEDVDTNAPPTASTTRVKITSIATRNGVTQVASVMAQVEPSPESNGVDVDLSEFAVFVSGSATFKDTATITRWPKAPASKFGERISIGTRQTSAGGIEFKNTAATIDTTLYYQTGSSASLVTNESGVSMQMKGLLDKIPLPDAPAAPTLSIATAGDVKFENTATVSANNKYHNLEVKSPGLLTLSGNITVVCENDLTLRDSSGIVVNGNVTLVVGHNLQLDSDSFIELQPGATLVMYVTNDSTVDDAYIGALRADRKVRDVTGALPYMDPQRIVFFGPTTGSKIDIKKQSVVNASIYGTRLTVNLTDNAAVYGRIASRFVAADKYATIFYDHALDSHGGYTNASSALYESDGHLKPSVNSLTNLSTSSLQSLADALLSPINGLLGLLIPSGGSGGSAYSVGPGDPTPRVVNVNVTGRVEGNDFNNWEVKANGAVVLVREDGGSDDTLNVKSRTPGHVSITP